MNRLKELRVGDPCIIANGRFFHSNHDAKVRHKLREAVVTKVGRLYVHAGEGGYKGAYRIEDRTEHTNYAPHEWLFVSEEEYTEYIADITPREDLARRLGHLCSTWNTLDKNLSTEAAQRIAAIYEDPASRIPKE